MENAEDPTQNPQNAAIKNARGKKIKIKDWWLYNIFIILSFADLTNLFKSDALILILSEKYILQRETYQIGLQTMRFKEINLKTPMEIKKKKRERLAKIKDLAH